MNQRFESLDIREFLFALKKHIKLLILLTLICAGCGYSVARWMILPLYESKAIIIVNAGENASSITYDQISTAQQLVNTYSIIFTSDTVLDQVIENLNLTTNADRLKKSITIESINNTEVIKISVRNPDAQLAADIANQIIEVAPTVLISAVKASSVEIISNAKSTDTSVYPNLHLFTAVFFAAGLVISVVISLAIEMLSTTFASGEDIQKFLQLTVIGVIPSSKKQAVSAQTILASSDALYQEAT